MSRKRPIERNAQQLLSPITMHRNALAFSFRAFHTLSLPFV